MKNLYAKGSLSAYDPQSPVSNFAPGPAPLPEEVMTEIHSELLNFNNCGQSVMALSHRSPEFQNILDECIKRIRDVMKIPTNFEVLFTHGGGHGQFAAVPLNLCAKKECIAEYIITGTWSERAATEAKKYVTVVTKDNINSSFNSDASYRYICSNETVNGIEFYKMPSFDDDVPLVVDMSSDFASKVIDWQKIGVAFACTPKNIGHPGLTVTVVRKDLLEREKQPICPGVFDWSIASESGLMWNTPATFNIYTTSKVMKWIQNFGGINAIAKRAREKAELIYLTIEESNDFYQPRCTDLKCRSRQNIPFKVANGDKEITDQFLKEAFEENMVVFFVKTPFGNGSWLRVSLYTGTTTEQTNKLARFMKEFSLANPASNA